MLCQVCTAVNDDDAEYCRRCQHKLLVLSGPLADEETVDADASDVEDGEGFSLEEHLLERISILEEVVKRSSESMRSLLGSLRKQEENILVNHAGLTAIQDVLDEQGLLSRDDWNERWEAKIDAKLMALERRDRFTAIKDRILTLYNGEQREAFAALLDEVEHAFASLDVARGMSALQEAHKIHRSNTQLAEFLGEARFDDGDLDAAMRCFAAVLEVRPDHYQSLLYSGVIHHQRGDNRAARGFLERVVGLYPETFLPLFALGAVEAGSGDLGRAVVYLERAVSVERLPRALLLLGQCYQEMGRLTPAIKHLGEAVRLDPGLEECYHFLGLCYLDRHWNRKALEAFRQAQRLSPRKMRYEDLVAYLAGKTPSLEAMAPQVREMVEVGERLLAQGDEHQSLAMYRRALAKEPDHPALLITYALACLQLDRNDEIVAVTQRVIDQNPGEMLRTTAYATLIASLRGQGKYREGNVVGRRLLDEGSSDFTKAIAYYEMAYNLAEMDEDLDEALSLAKRALEHSPDELKQFPLAALGWVHYKREEYDQAVEYLSRSAELGDNATTMMHLGMALLASGRKDRARNVFSSLRQLDGSSRGLEARMLDFVRDSAQILSGLQSRRAES